MSEDFEKARKLSEALQADFRSFIEKVNHLNSQIATLLKLPVEAPVDPPEPYKGKFYKVDENKDDNKSGDSSDTGIVSDNTDNGNSDNDSNDSDAEEPNPNLHFVKTDDEIKQYIDDKEKEIENNDTNSSDDDATNEDQEPSENSEAESTEDYEDDSESDESEASSMPKFGFVTFCDNNNYAKGAIVLARSLRHVGTTADLVCLVTSNISSEVRSQLDIAFDKLVTVDIIDSKDEANLALLKRPELGVTLTKLHVWKLTDYDKMVFCDADMVVVRNIDDLFDREELSAVPDCGWPSCFNTGLFVFRPSLETFGKLLAHAEQFGSFDGGDQGLFNSYFSDWSTADISRILPFGYNVHAASTYTYAPAYKHFANDVRVVHFLGSAKPWTSRSPPAGSSFNHFWSVWWKFYSEQYTEQDSFAPTFTPTTCAVEAVAAPARPEYLDQDTDEAAEKRWLENSPDYMNKDKFENILAHIDNEIKKDAFY